MKTPAFLVSFILINFVASTTASAEEVHVCPTCDCTSETLRNLQQTLDSCRRVSEINQKVLKMYENNNKMLTASLGRSSEDDTTKFKEDRDNLLSMVNDLQVKLEYAAKKESKFEDQKEDLLEKIDRLEAELKAVSLLSSSNVTASD